MGILKILKSNTENFKKIESLNDFLNKNGIILHQTVYNGIIYEVNDKFYKHFEEGQYPESVPPQIEGKWVECDEMGNTDYYQEF